MNRTLQHGFGHVRRGGPRRHGTAARSGGGVLPMVLSGLVVNESTPSIDFTVTGGDGTAYIALSANAVETASAVRNWPTPATRFSFPVSLGGVSQSLDFSGVPDGTYYLHIVGENAAGLQNVLTYGPVDIAAAPVRSKTYAGNITPGSGNILNGSLDIGAASAGRLVVVGLQVNKGTQIGLPTVTVNGVTLTGYTTPITGNYYSVFVYGLVPTGDGVQAINITFTDGALPRSANVWVLRNLGSNAPTGQGGTNASAGPVSETVVSGEYLLAMRFRQGAPEGLSNGPSQTPDRQATIGPQSSFYLWSGDWTIASSSSSFDLGLDFVTSSNAYVRFA